jgi:hypothetical protein
MQLEQRIEALSKLGLALSAMIEELDSNKGESGNKLPKIIKLANIKNQWFTSENTIQALKSLGIMLDRTNLNYWIGKYSLEKRDYSRPKNVGIIMAGNIPAVGFHDLLCVLITGNHAMIKLASDDNIIIPFLLEVLTTIEPRFISQFTIVERIKEPDAVIATGSNNSARYFDYYFGKYPNIIRKNRNSIAVLSGTETPEEMYALGHDIFDYFGLGCRSVSKLYVPENFNFNTFFEGIATHGDLMNHNKYMNNYDYHNALFLLENIKFLTNNFVIVRENESLATPVSVLHYSYYKNLEELEKLLNEKASEIQCRVGINGLPFGKSQQPALNDYADGIDTVEWLLNL